MLICARRGGGRPLDWSAASRRRRCRCSPAQLARFCAAALGWEVTCSDDSYGMVEDNGIKIGFGKVEGFRPAQQPDETGAKRFPLDLQVDDLDEATQRLCTLEVSQPDIQPGAGRWRVLLDTELQLPFLNPRPAATP